MLDGIRVVEVAGSVGVAWAAKLLADLGADVVRLEGDDDLVRNRPHDVHRWLNTNKRAMHDRPGEREELIAEADILFHALARSAAGLTFAELTATSPRLVYVRLHRGARLAPTAATPPRS